MTILGNFLLGRVSISCKQHQLPFLASFLNPKFHVKQLQMFPIIEAENRVIWRLIILPIRAEDVRSPGGFNFTHSSTISFHFLTKKQNPKSTNLQQPFPTLANNFPMIFLVLQNLTSSFTNLRTSCDWCFRNRFTCLPISVSYNSQIQSEKKKVKTL